MTSVKNRLYASSRTRPVDGRLPWHFVALYGETARWTPRGYNSKEPESFLIKAGRLNGASGIPVMSLIFHDFSAIN